MLSGSTAHKNLPSGVFLSQVCTWLTYKTAVQTNYSDIFTVESVKIMSGCHVETTLINIHKVSSRQGHGHTVLR